jgi:propanol-preferring alcohol dehydrogenase
MATMTAFRLTAWGQPPELVPTAMPRPGPGDVLVKVGAVGLCGSDAHLLSAPPGAIPFPLPFTLGHEVAGWVAELGPGSGKLAVGTAVLASSVDSCGTCEWCTAGLDNYCPRAVSMQTRGIGYDGGLSEFVVVPERQLVELRSLDPTQAAPLSDAGATSYHAVKSVLTALAPGSTALVIGVGGLGGYAVQYLRVLSAARVIAVDVDPGKVTRAHELGAHDTLLSGGVSGDAERDAAAAAVLALTAGRGVDAVLDFCGMDDTLALACATVRPLGRVVVVGIGGGTVPFGWRAPLGAGAQPPGAQLALSIGFTLGDLREVVALAEAGRLVIDAERFPFAAVGSAYDRLLKGEIRSRAVVSVAEAI